MPEKRYGILIANQDYAEDTGFHPLRCPMNDARALKEVLDDPAHGEFTETRILADGERREILLELEEFLQKAGRDDLVFIYFSGHGTLDKRGNLFFAGRSTRADRLRATGVNASDISELILESTVRKKALVLDCCYAGAFARNWKSAADMVQERADEFARGSGTYVLMATDELSLAEEDHEAGISVFTKHLVDGLRGKADANNDGIITLTELSTYVHRQVVDLHNQVPIEAGISKRDEIAISKSGLGQDRERRQAIRGTLLEWAQGNFITDDVLSEALACLDAGPAPAVGHGRTRLAILERVADEDFGPGPFLAAWFRAEFDRPEPEARTVPPRRQPAPNPPVEPAGCTPAGFTSAPGGPWSDGPPATQPKDRKPAAEVGVLLSLGWLIFGVVAVVAGAVIFEEENLSFTGAYNGEMGDGAMAGAAMAIFFGLRRFVRKRHLIGWIAKVIYLGGSVAIAGIAFAFFVNFM